MASTQLQTTLYSSAQPPVPSVDKEMFRKSDKTRDVIDAGGRDRPTEVCQDFAQLRFDPITAAGDQSCACNSAIITWPLSGWTFVIRPVRVACRASPTCAARSIKLSREQIVSAASLAHAGANNCDLNV